MNNEKKTSRLTLNEWAIDLHKQPAIIKRFDSVELYELKDFLNELQTDLFGKINAFLCQPNLNHEHYNLEWAFENYQTGFFSFNRLEYLNKLITERLNVLHSQSLKPGGPKNWESDVFKKQQTEIYFNEYVEKYINTEEPHKAWKQFSFLFKKLLDLNLIYQIQVKPFMYWLKDNNYIDEQTYDYFIHEKGQFEPLGRVNGKINQNNFNNIFKDLNK